MLFTFLAACLTAPTDATGSASSDATIRELDVDGGNGSYTAEASEPGAIVVACESEAGALTYGPREDPRISYSWSPEDGGIYSIGADARFVDCHIWQVR
ncbi:MAG: hypothetical protein RL409_438 [Gemmatimonadota bacterium]|jgi:hypothetical protein